MASLSDFLLCSFDTRYKRICKIIAEYWSDPIYYSKRIEVELAYLRFLFKKDGIEYEIPEFDRTNHDVIFAEWNACCKEEAITKHDVKAIEYYLRTIIPEEYHNYIHMGLTSQDINSVAQTMMIKNTVKVFIEKYKELEHEINNFIIRLKDVVVMTYTHSQPATASYFDIEIFKHLLKIKESIARIIADCNNLTCKFSCSNGNFTTLSQIIDEHEISELYDFLNCSLGLKEQTEMAKASFESGETDYFIDYNLKFNMFATQIDNYNSYSNLFYSISTFFGHLKNLSFNLWLYVFKGELKQKSIAGECGSSVMPHKINPIGIETCGFGMTQEEMERCDSLARSLSTSAGSRDISDTFKLRDANQIFALGLLIFHNMKTDIVKLEPNLEKIHEILHQNIASLGEIIQTNLRMQRGIKTDAYKLIEGLTKGKQITYEELHEFIDDLKAKFDLPDELITRFKSYRIDKPFGYFSHYRDIMPKA
jgi:adenylosuccinate lyase